jgi:hypothetical protein
MPYGKLRRFDFSVRGMAGLGTIRWSCHRVQLGFEDLSPETASVAVRDAIKMPRSDDLAVHA